MVSRRFTLPPSALLLLLTLAAAPVAAQTKAPSAVPAAPAPAAPPTDTSQPAVPDLMPLKKALAPLAGNGLLEVNSSFKVTGIRAGSTLTFRENLHILARRGGFFRVNLLPVGVDGPPRPKLLVISDGKRVWTYCPGLRAYSVTTRQAFIKSDVERYTLGLASSIFDNGHVLTDMFRGVTKENNTVAVKELTQGGLFLTSKVQSLGGVDCIVYRMVFQKQNVSLLFYVDPQKNTLKRLDSTDNTDGMQIVLQETLTTLRVPTSVPANTFTWSPPPGVKKSSKVTAN